MTTDVTKTRTVFLQAQQKEKSLREEISGLEYDLQEARSQEEAAAVAVLDGNSIKTVEKATARIRMIEDALRVKLIQLQTLAKRTQEASAKLDDVLAAERQAAQESDYRELQDEIANVTSKLAELNQAVGAAKAKAVGIVERYRAAGGRGANLQTFSERLRQLICNQLSEVSLLERGGNPDPAAALAGYVSEIQFIVRAA